MTKKQTAEEILYEAAYHYGQIKLEESTSYNFTISNLKKAYIDGGKYVLSNPSLLEKDPEVRPAPPAAGPVTGFAILYEALDNIAHSTAFPIGEEQCYIWIKTAQEMADKAMKQYNSESRPPAPAGPVWVSLANDFPENWETKVFRRTCDKAIVNLADYWNMGTRIEHKDNSSLKFEYSELEWLDFEERQVFNREQVAKAYSDGAIAAQLRAGGYNFQTEAKYMETNYPTNTIK